MKHNLGELPTYEVGEEVATAVYWDDKWHEGVVVEPEVYWPQKRSIKEVRIEVDCGRCVWTPKEEVVKRTE